MEAPHLYGASIYGCPHPKNFPDAAGFILSTCRKIVTRFIASSPHGKFFSNGWKFFLSSLVKYYGCPKYEQIRRNPLQLMQKMNIDTHQASIHFFDDAHAGWGCMESFVIETFDLGYLLLHHVMQL